MTKPKKATVDVELTESNSPPGFTWQIESDLKKGKKLEFNNDHHPGFIVYFDIDDDDDTGFRFPDDHNRAIAVQTYTGTNPPCPTAGATWDQFYPIAVSKNNTRLEVRNLNEDPAEFAYTLFVTKDPHGTNPALEPIDPIGSNQNGPRLEPASSFGTVALVVGVAAVAVALAFTFNIFERR